MEQSNIMDKNHHHASRQGNRRKGLLAKFALIGIVLTFFISLTIYFGVDMMVKRNGKTITPTKDTPLLSLDTTGLHAASPLLHNSAMVCAALVTRHNYPQLRLDSIGQHMIQQNMPLPEPKDLKWKNLEKAVPGITVMYQRGFDASNLDRDLSVGKMPILQVSTPTATKEWVILIGSTGGKYTVLAPNGPGSLTQKILEPEARVFTYRILVKVGIRS